MKILSWRRSRYAVRVSTILIDLKSTLWSQRCTHQREEREPKIVTEMTNLVAENLGLKFRKAWLAKLSPVDVSNERDFASSTQRLRSSARARMEFANPLQPLFGLLPFNALCHVRNRLLQLDSGSTIFRIAQCHDALNIPPIETFALPAVYSCYQ